MIEVTEEKLRHITEQVIQIVLKKNHDYGNAWQRHDYSWILRIVDKLYRVETLADGRQALVLNESIEDTLRDVIGYSLLGLLYLRKE